MSLPPTVVNYFGTILKEIQKQQDVAEKARQRTGSPTPEVEPVFADDLAERVELLVGPKGIAEKIRSLQMKLGRKLLAFKLAEEIVYSSLGKDSDERVIKQALTTALAVLTPPCITAAPSEGISDVRIKKNLDGSTYLAVYFAGPIRAAGGTELAAVVVLADYIRRIFGLGRYKPTDDEVRRFIEELRTYTRNVSRFQYSISERAVDWALRNIPVEITGVPTDKIIVPSFRNLPRIETDFLRGGALRVLNDGIIGRAKKVRKIVTDMSISGWDWLQEIAKDWSKKKTEESDTAGYLDEIIGGRPVFSFPHAFGGFRLRYGRSKASGLATLGLHPLTMEVLENYLVTGTQLKTEYPGKGGTVTPVDSIEPPVVLTSDGSVVRVSSKEIFEEIREKISEILFLGDILVSFGDFMDNNEVLRPPGYCEEWWTQELEAALEESSSEKNVALAIDSSLLNSFVRHPFHYTPTAAQAMRISSILGVPLHPRHLAFWERLGPEEVLYLRTWLRDALRQVRFDANQAFLPFDAEAKAALTRILLEHKVQGESLSLSKENLRVLIGCLQPHREAVLDKGGSADSMSLIQQISGISLRKKGESFVGTRMGRPEKAGPRMMNPPVHVLFPVSVEGGPSRDLVAVKNKRLNVELMTRKCVQCESTTWRTGCEKCGASTHIAGICPRCGETVSNPQQDSCPRCNSKISFSRKTELNLDEEFKRVQGKLHMELPRHIKGVRGLTSRTKCPEMLEKGFLRARHGLYVYKDGTVRFDSTNAPMTHFTPKEIGVSVQRLRELEYTYDAQGFPLTNDHQTCELKIQDIVMSTSAAEYLLRTSIFVDDVLRLTCGLEPYYNFHEKQDMIGCLVVGLSPHTYVGVVGRIIGFIDAEVCLAHPIWHAAKRRDCDGDEDAVMLLLDVLINFSELYLPDRIGGKMDSPLLITATVNPAEVDEQAHNFDITSNYPMEFYERALQAEPANRVYPVITLVRNALFSGGEYVGMSFTHPQSNLEGEAKQSIYKKLSSMNDKIVHQLALSDKLSSVDIHVVAEKVLLSHVLPDIVGNLRAFFTQSFRCKKCNKKFRRLPMTHFCDRCGGGLAQTVFRGNIEKYVKLAVEDLEKYVVNQYTRDRLELILENIRATFAEEKQVSERFEGGRIQVSLEDFVQG